MHSQSPQMVHSLPTMKGTHLSKREMEVLFYVVRGKTAKGIGKLLTISPRTVEQYMKNIKIKMNVYSKSELIEKVVEQLV